MFLLIALLSAFAVGGAVALGGGGGGGGGAAPAAVVSSGTTYIADPSWISTVNTSQINSYKTTEYNAQFGLGLIHAAEAYSLLQTNGKSIAGDNIKIAISDTGVRATHQEISANYDSADSTSQTDLDGHGTHVASTAAGVKDGNGMHGVAFNADIISMNVLGTNAPGNVGEAGIDYAAIRGAKVVNMSWGYVDGSHNPIYANSSSDSAYISIKNQIKSEFTSAVSHDVFMAVATGNDGANNATHVSMPALFAADSATNGQMIAVGAVDQNNNITAYSNRCSQVKDYCLVAPGGANDGNLNHNINAAGISSDTSYAQLAGTSMATPQVSGAAAVLRAAWPYLSARQTVRILLDTATDLGAAGVDDVYGHGMLNLGNAVTAQGPNHISSSSLMTSAGYDAQSSSIATHAIFGDAYMRNVAPILQNAVFFDMYGRDYKANLDQKISSNSSSSYNLDNILFNSYSSASLPLHFGEDYSNNLVVRFNTQNIFSDSDSGEIKHNKFGLKHLTVDNSKDDQSSFGASDVSFSYTRNFGKDYKFSFSKNDFSESFNIDNPAYSYNLISFNNFISSPYKKLSLGAQANNRANDFTGSNPNQINSNQFSFAQKINENLSASFSFSNYNQSSMATHFSSDESRIFESNLGYKLNDKTKLNLGFGNLNEMDNNFLGSKAEGAFSGGSNPQTKYFNLNITRNLFKNWKLTTSHSEGQTEVSGNDIGVFRDYSNIRSKGSAIGILNDDFFGGRLGIVYSEPLRVYKGKANIDIPISRDADGNVQRLTANGVSLKPDGKEQDLEFSYSFNLKNNSEINFNSIIQKEAGNIKDAQNQYLWMVRYNWKY